MRARNSPSVPMVGVRAPTRKRGRPPLAGTAFLAPEEETRRPTLDRRPPSDEGRPGYPQRRAATLGSVVGITNGTPVPVLPGLAARRISTLRGAPPVRHCAAAARIGQCGAALACLGPARMLESCSSGTHRPMRGRPGLPGPARMLELQQRHASANQEGYRRVWAGSGHIHGFSLVVLFSGRTFSPTETRLNRARGSRLADACSAGTQSPRMAVLRGR